MGRKLYPQVRPHSPSLDLSSFPLLTRDAADWKTYVHWRTKLRLEDGKIMKGSISELTCKLDFHLVSSAYQRLTGNACVGEMAMSVEAVSFSLLFFGLPFSKHD